WIQKNKIAGFGFSREFKRFYPLFHLASHVVGFTDLDGEGLEGVERYFNEFLKGKDGYQYIAVDALGRPLNEKPLKAQMPEHGGNLVLTIDSVIQNYVEEELNRIMLHWQPKATFAVVVDVRNGKVLAMANRPDFDPNHPAQFPTEARRNRLLTDYYEPGSTIKVFTAFGALKAKVVTLEDTFFCHYGRFQFGPRRITDTHGYGDLSVRMIVVKSSNIGMAQIGVKLGDKKVRQNILDFGFGKKTGIELPGEVAGKVTSEKRWSFYSTTSVAMGYEIGVTALQLAMGYSAIANGGYLYRPTLVEKLIWNGKVVGKSRPCCVRRIYNDPQLQKQMLSILQGVVEEGTAKRARLSDYTMGGKTGTARRNAKGRRGYTGKYLASFVAVAPITRPRLVVVVMTDSPKGAMYGGTVSAPAAARIMQKSLHYLGVPPDKGKEKKDEKEKT
ncbi:MAG: penicillin-binding protein 2, partial [Planctomycetota bacterium]